MRRYWKSANPFYILLVIVGVSFVLTAIAYGVMLWRQTAPPRTAAEAAAAVDAHPLLEWMNRHGDTALLVELSVLAASTLGAIGTDSFWQRRAKLQRGMN